MGFYIPDWDVDWDSEFYKFRDIDWYEENRKKRCDVKVCQLCPDVIGSEGRQTEVILCVLCGTNGCHVKFAGLSDEEEFRCEDCWGSVELERVSRPGGESSVLEVSATSGSQSSVLEVSRASSQDDSDVSMELFVISDSEDSPLNACSVDFFQNVDDFIKQFELDKGLSSS